MLKITMPANLDILKQKQNLKDYAYIKDCIKVIIMLLEGHTWQEISVKLDKSRSFVFKWADRFNKGGLGVHYLFLETKKHI